jgi:hypothetical protein
MGKRIKANEVAEERYYKIPKAFFLTEKYKTMSLEAKVIYGFLKDRSSLSLKNNWIDEEGSVYLIFTRKHIQEMLCLSDKPVTKAFKQLIEFGLIEEERQGLNKPNLIYVCHIDFANIEEMRIRTKSDSSNGENTNLGSEEIRSNDTDIIYTDSIDIIEGNEVRIREGTPKGDTKSIPFYDFLLKDIKRYNTSYKLEIVESIIYYYGKYYEKFGEEHRRYKEETLKEIYTRLDTIFDIGIQDNDYDKLLCVDSDTLKEIIDQHFKTNYSGNMSWTLLSFLNDNVLKNRCYEVGVV